MKKQFTYLTLSLLLVVGKLVSQNYLPIATTGYTLDAVAESTTAASTTGHPIDGSYYVLYSQACGQMISSSAYGLPNNGLLSTGTRTYQLQPYNTVNMLYIPGGGKDSLTLVTPASYPVLSLLGFATEGAISAQVSYTVRYTDNSTQVYSGYSMQDWFNGTGSVVAQGFDRISTANGNPDYNSSNPRMYYTDLAIPCNSQGKLIQRVIVQNGSTAGPRICIMGLSGTSAGYSVSASTLITCGAQNVTLTANGMTSYSWQPVGSFAGSSSSSVVVTPSVSTTYTLTGTATSSCPGAAQITINASTAVPSLSLAGSTSTVCLGGVATLSASGALTYTFSNGIANGGTFTPVSTANYTVTGANGCGASSVVTTVTVSPLSLTATASNTLICAGTAATLTGGGATNYTWTPGPGTGTNYIISPSSNTTYTVNGKTGACTGSTTIVVSTKPNPTLSISASSPAVCIGNSANLTVTGNALTYTWSVGNQTGTSISVTPTMVTLYSVTGTNSVNCVSTANMAILVNQSPTLTTGVSNPVVCAGDPSTLTVSGASTYTWTTGDLTSTAVVNPTTNMTYSVTGTSTAGCVSTSVASVSVLTPTISVSSNTAMCKGSNVSISANGADTYTWSNNVALQTINVSPSLTTVYTVTGSVTDPNTFISCNATNTVQVTVNPNPTVTASANHSVICMNTSALLTASGASSYTWTGGPGATQSATMSVSPIANQTYSVVGLDANGCKGTATIMISISPCTGIASIATTNANLLVYPNPSNGAFTITCDQTITLQVINELGQLVTSVKLDEENNHKAVIDNMPAGLYFVQSTDASVKQKIVVTK